MASAKLNHLQGLRGIAILAVVLFHFFPSQFTNGYIGVDIFFLLSGYLMTMMMSRYEAIDFYKIMGFLYKRLKRIAPLYFLSILFILLVLQLTPTFFTSANITPAWHAILFITNILQTDNVLEYFEKLGTAVDLFTHTWSLSLEVQYYLFFPLIFIVYRLFSEEKGQFFLIISSFFSFLFYILADDFTSFNSMFARIWQFNAGTLAFIYSTPIIFRKEELFEQRKLLENEGDETNKKLSKLNDFSGTVNLSLLILGVLLCYQKAVDSDFSRIMSILLTMAIIQYGQGNKFLENKFLVFIGEVSYGWYLFHWPIAAYCKQQQYSFEVFLGAFSTSFLFSVLIHFVFEKNYLRWEKPAICSIVLILLAINVGLLVKIDASLASVGDRDDIRIKKFNISSSILEEKFLENAFFWPSDFIENVTYGYENKTKEEIIMLNDYYSSTDSERLTNFCKKEVKTNFSAELRCQLNEGANMASKERLLVIGNSWAANVMPLIRDECQDKFSHLELSWRPACEPLLPGIIVNRFDCAFNKELYIEAVKEVQPDVLFIVAKNINMFFISNGSTPLNDFHFLTATRQLTEIQKFVKRRIFILDAFPLFNQLALNSDLKEHLSSGKELDIKGYVNIDEHYAIAKMRYSRLVTECPKCKLFEYTPQFYLNGKIFLYDPKHFVSFLSTNAHLNPPAAERVRPIYRHLCSLK